MKFVHRISYEITLGLNYLVSKHILHRDLKSHNILLNVDSVPPWERVDLDTVPAQSLRACICDFGLARHSDHLTQMTGTPGTPAWMAPEVIRNEPVDEKCDVYSFGVVLWELMTRQTPWEGMEAAQIMFAVAGFDRRLPLPKDCPPAFAQLISSCWHKVGRLGGGE
jgi:serine/threonine protein kinase